MLKIVKYGLLVIVFDQLLYNYKLDLVESEKYSAWRKYTRNYLPVWLRKKRLL